MVTRHGTLTAEDIQIPYLTNAVPPQHRYTLPPTPTHCTWPPELKAPRYVERRVFVLLDSTFWPGGGAHRATISHMPYGWDRNRVEPTL